MTVIALLVVAAIAWALMEVYLQLMQLRGRISAWESHLWAEYLQAAARREPMTSPSSEGPCHGQSPMPVNREGL